MLFRSFAIALLITGPAWAGPVKKADKVVDSAQEAVDPDCTVSKAAKGAAMKATVGVGNRCDVAETARDVTGVDGKGEDIKDVLN